MEEKTFTAFLFLKVPSLQSGPVVEQLSKVYNEVKEAAAVYSEIDIVARISASRGRLGEILLELMQEAIHVYDPIHDISETFTVDSVRPFLVDGTLSWRQKERGIDTKRDIYAYILVEVDENVGTKTQVLQNLHKCEGVIYTASLVKRARIIAKVKAPTKRAFDDKIMDQIQAIPGVAATRSLLVINDMHFVRAEPTIYLEPP